MNNQVLFLGITNHCASRFAEILFNQMASEQLLKYQGVSRGVLLKAHENELDSRCLEALVARGIPLPGRFRPPLALKPSDIKNAFCIVLLDGAELLHRLQRSSFIQEKELVLWDFKDVSKMAPADLFPALEAEVHLLVRRLQHTPLLDLDPVI